VQQGIGVGYTTMGVRMRICIVSSSGGHLTEVRCLRPAYEAHEHLYVLNKRVALPPDMEGRTIFITHAERDWRVLLNLWEAWKIMRDFRPDVILSTGAGPVVPFAIVGRLFFRLRIVFVETFTRISLPSLTGRIMYRLADVFFYQWQTLAKYFPKGKYLGRLV